MNVRRPDAPSTPSVSKTGTSTPVTPAAPQSTNKAAAPAPRETLGRPVDTKAAARLGAPVNQPSAHVASPGPVSLGTTAAQKAVQTTYDYLNSQNRGIAAVAGAEKSFTPSTVERDELGMTHVRMDRVHDGVKVFGEQIISHLDSQGNVASVTGDANASALPTLDRTKLISGAQALETAKQDFGLKTQNQPKPELVYFKANDGQYHAAYNMELNNFTDGQKPQRMSYMVDAQSGKVLDKWNNIDGIQLPKNTADAPTPVTVKASATPNAAIEDMKSTTSTIDIADDITVDQLKFNVDVNHTYRGDLTATLTSPSGKSITLLNREGGSADDWKGSFDLSQFAGESAKGQWKLTIEDKAKRDVGTLNSWGMEITGHGKDNPPPPPPTGTADDTTMYSGKVDVGATKGADGKWTLEDGTRGGGVVTYDANNKSTASGKTQFTDDNNIWGEATDNARTKAAVDAQYGAQMTYDFYKDVLGRDSIDGKGEKLVNYVHLSNNYNNAYWDGKQMQYGDGDGKTFSPLTSIDVAGHEITHGMTERTAGLVYRGESGGLNEAMSDIFGKGVEWYAAQKNPNVKFSWNIGESIYTPGKPGDALRYMGDPTKDGYSIDNYKNYPKQTEVHGSSGIANNAFYLMVEGGTNKTSGQKVDQGIGMEKALKIMYRAETFYMTPNTTFAQAKEAAVKAATDLYGADSAEVKATTQAWTAVGL